MQAATHVIDQNWGRHALGPRMHQHGRRRQNQAANQLVADASDALVEESLTDAPCWVNLAKRATIPRQSPTQDRPLALSALVCISTSQLCFA